MIAAVPLLLFGGLIFVEKDIPGFTTDPWHPETGFRQADLDGDGRLDLITSAGICFQQQDGFDIEHRAQLPNTDESAECDVWGNALYLLFTHRLEIVRWEKGAWNCILSQPSEWLRQGSSAQQMIEESQRGKLEFVKCLHDLDGDNVPEIVCAKEDGIHVYRRNADAYVEAARLDIYPPLTQAPGLQQALWPPTARGLAFPESFMFCHVCLEQNRITILTREDCPDTRVRYRTKQYTIDASKGFSISPDATREVVTEPLPPHLYPRRLNNDDALDYAGGDLKFSDTSVLQVPIFTVQATLDGGKTIQSIRSRSLRPRHALVDFNHDGNEDIVAHTMCSFEGGVRECVSRFLSSREIEHEIHIHLQNSQGVFSKAADVEGRFTIHLDAPMHKYSKFFRDYLAGTLVDVSGDCNGDGRNDAVVRDQPDRLSVYCNTGAAFSKRPDATIAAPEESEFGIADVDGDGRSDIICWSRPSRSESKVFFAREAGP